LGLSLLAGPALAQGTYKIGEINSYKAQPAFLEPYKKGMELAVEQVNASGGIAGRKLQLVVRDDNANPGDAVRAAEELLAREKVDVLMGSFLSHVGLALTDFARQKKVFFLAAEPLTVPTISLRNAYDNYVMPQDNQRLPGAQDIELPPVGHIAMLYDRRVARLLIELLNPNQP
jgi:ABC-type branched-subunit amino acid transport system substrate-binding protein